MAKIPWHKNAKFRVRGTTLHIEVELDEDKVDASENGYLSSVETNLLSPPVRVNVWV